MKGRISVLLATALCGLAGADVRVQPACRVVAHEIVAGDRLEQIATRHGVTVDMLERANRIDAGDMLEPGGQVLVPVPLEALLPEKMRRVLRLQVGLDRSGFVPGKLDGMDGKFTRTMAGLAGELGIVVGTNRPAVVLARVPQSVEAYVDTGLPGSGAAPDFKALSGDQRRPLRYRSRLELLAERWHCAERLLERLNPELEFAGVLPGSLIAVPDVEPFRIEDWMTSEGVLKRSLRANKDGADWLAGVFLSDRLLRVWRDGRLVAAFPVTVNEAGTPVGVRVLGRAVVAPPYFRRETGLDLLSGPNSPVGVAWCPLGDGYGIHGTSNPRWIGRNSSAGCIRLANWDVVRFAALVPEGAGVIIGEPTAPRAVVVGR